MRYQHNLLTLTSPSKLKPFQSPAQVQGFIKHLFNMTDQDFSKRSLGNGVALPSLAMTGFRPFDSIDGLYDSYELVNHRLEDIPPHAILPWITYIDPRPLLESIQEDSVEVAINTPAFDSLYQTIRTRHLAVLKAKGISTDFDVHVLHQNANPLHIHHLYVLHQPDQD